MELADGNGWIVALCIVILVFGGFIGYTLKGQTVITKEVVQFREKECPACVKTECSACPDCVCNSEKVNLDVFCNEPPKYKCMGSITGNITIDKMQVRCSDGRIKYWSCANKGWI